MVLWRSKGIWIVWYGDDVAMFLRPTFVRSNFVQRYVLPMWCLSYVMFVQCDVCPMWYLSDCSVCLTAVFVWPRRLSDCDVCLSATFVKPQCLSEYDVCPNAMFAQSRSKVGRTKIASPWWWRGLKPFHVLPKFASTKQSRRKRTKLIISLEKLSESFILIYCC